MSRRKLSAAVSACAVVSTLTTAIVLAIPLPVGARTADLVSRADDGSATASGPRITPEQVNAEVRPEEVAALGRPEAEGHAWARLALRGVGDYPQTTRTARLEMLTRTQQEINGKIDAAAFGKFTDYFSSPDFGVHIALLPTGKVLVFSFEAMESNPQKETAPTDTTGKENAGTAYLWDPDPKVHGQPAEFEKVTPPVVNMPDGLDELRPAPFFCAGHSFLPNGMLGVFGGNLGGNGGSGAKLSLVFDPWQKKWYQEQDMTVGRWYPSVVTGADGRQLIMSGHSELGWGTPTPIVERFPAKVDGVKVPKSTIDRPVNFPVDSFKAQAPFRSDYPQLFSLRDGKIYALGRNPDQQWLFDPADESRSSLPDRPESVPVNAVDAMGGPKRDEAPPATAKARLYGSAVALPGGKEGPDSVLLLGGNRNDPNTYKLAPKPDGSGYEWKADSARAFGRTQDDTLILPDGTLLTVNGAFDIRDYGTGKYNPNADLKYRHIELRDAQGSWKTGPVQRLPRGYHSNAVLLPDGRVMITGDELQQIANNPDIKKGPNGTIEIYEPPYLNKGVTRPTLDEAPESLKYDETFKVTATGMTRAVLMAPVTSTHAVDTSQRHLELEISRAGGVTTLTAPPSAAAAPPGYYMLFVLDENNVPSIAKWVQLGAETLNTK